MEHNLVGDAKCYSYGNIKISRSSECIKEIDDSKKDFFRHW
jgi:hypothetical protein